MSDVAPWLPPEEGYAPYEVRSFFRTVDLSARELSDVQRLAAVVVQGDFFFREERLERLEMDWRQATAEDPPPIPEQDPASPQHHRYVRDLAVETHRCTNCVHFPGHTACPVCGSSTTIEAVSGDHVACPGCHGKGYVHCGSCDGAGKAIWTETVFVTDAVDHVRKVFVDSELLGDRLFALQHHVADAALPDALETSLDERSGRGPYRDAAPKEREFHGYRFGDAIEQARRELAFHERRRPIRRSVRVFAYPFVDGRVQLLRRSYRRLMCVGPDGQPRHWFDEW